MPYRRGRPLVDISIFFRIASDLVFYPVGLLAYGVYKSFYGSRIIGRTKLKNQKKAVLVSNHTTMLDPALISAAAYPRRIYHTLLESVVLVPVLGTFCRLLGGIPVPPNLRSMFNLPEECAKALEYRRFIHFYPEGECYTRNQDVFPFRHGAFLAAAKLDVPVIPMATVFMSDKTGKKPLVRLYVLDPVYPSQFGCTSPETGKTDIKAIRDFAEYVHDCIQKEIDKRGGTRKFYKGAMPRIVGEKA